MSVVIEEEEDLFAPKNDGWSLMHALRVIRTIQKPCMEAGYYIALAGGVLNRGFSANDLDLVAVRRINHDQLDDLVDVLEKFIGPCIVGNIEIVKDSTHLKFPTQKIEIRVVK